MSTYAATSLQCDGVSEAFEWATRRLVVLAGHPASPRGGEHRSPAVMLLKLLRLRDRGDVLQESPVSHVKRPRVGADLLTVGLTRDELEALLQAEADRGRRR